MLGIFPPEWRVSIIRWALRHLGKGHVVVELYAETGWFGLGVSWKVGRKGRVLLYERYKRGESSLMASSKNYTNVLARQIDAFSSDLSQICSVDACGKCVGFSNEFLGSEANANKLSWVDVIRSDLAISERKRNSKAEVHFIKFCCCNALVQVISGLKESLIGLPLMVLVEVRCANRASADQFMKDNDYVVDFETVVITAGDGSDCQYLGFRKNA